MKSLAVLGLGFSITFLGPHLSAASGDLDPTFTPAPGPNGSVRAMALQTDGKIVVAGDFTSVSGQPRLRVARLLANGTLDTDFVTTAGPDGSVAGVAVQTDGKVLITGNFNNVGAVGRKFYARLNANGSLDTAFAVTQPFLVTGQMTSIQALPDGNVLMAGGLIYFTLTVNRSGVMRVNSAGAVDASFAPAPISGSVLSGFGQADGSVIVAGALTVAGSPQRTNIVRLNSSGALDTTFTAAIPSNLIGFTRAVAQAPGGKYVAIGNGNGGTDSSRVSWCVGFLGNGAGDNGFTPAGANASILAQAVQPDGAILIAGDFTEVNGVRRLKVARLTASGALDANFDVGDGAGTSVNALAVQPNGQILVAGAFPIFNNTVLGPVVRLQAGLVLSGAGLAGGAFGVNAFTTAGKTYTLQYKTDLSQTTWTSAPPVNGTGAVVHFADPTAGGSLRWYRLVEN
jgi:uncharacterized delta-60 repeat protein